ncbi:unnamed protein product, partial [Linum tenue]
FDGRERFRIDKEDHRSSNEKELTVCYKCGKTGHIRSKCPAGMKTKEKAMAASWSDLSSDEDHETKDLAYMAFATNKEDDCQSSSSRDHGSPSCYQRLGVSENIWFLDSGCSHHMTGTDRYAWTK